MVWCHVPGTDCPSAQAAEAWIWASCSPMGWPIGHALCACSATEFTHWQQHMRGALSQLPMASGPWIWRPTDQVQRPAQMSLFEEMQP
jgi:hypothetical protein